MEVALVLSESGRSDLLMSDYVQTLLNVYWSLNKWKIFWRAFVPYLFYLGVTLAYFFNVLLVHEEEESSWKYIYAIINLCSLFYQLYIESVQLFQSDDPKRFTKYFTNPMNLFDLFQYMTCLMMMILSMLNLDWPTLPTRRIIAALLVFILWFKMFDWMRLFDSTSFYIKLILVTIYDIMPFMVIYVIFLLMFGCAMDCISLNRGENDEIIESYIGWWFIDLLINQHLLGLGDFSMETYSG